MNRTRAFWILLLVTAHFLTFENSGWTKDGDVSTDSVIIRWALPNRTPEDAVRKPGWTPGLRLSGSFNLGSNSNVPGRPDGTSITVGVNLSGELDFNHKNHEWRNSLSLVETLTRAPGLPAFIKTVDRLRTESIYLYLVGQKPEWGPFARAQLDASVFRSFDVRSEPTTFIIQRPQGTETVLSSSLMLNGIFAPMTLDQAVGIFLRPVNRERISIETRTGIGARQVFARGELAVVDDPGNSGPVLVEQLENNSQLGLEFTTRLAGRLSEERLQYLTQLSLLMPFRHSAAPEADRKSAFQLTNIELQTRIAYKLVNWASVAYELRAIRQPQLLSFNQVSNALLLTLDVTFLGDNR